MEIFELTKKFPVNISMKRLSGDSMTVMNTYLQCWARWKRRPIRSVVHRHSAAIVHRSSQRSGLPSSISHYEVEGGLIDILKKMFETNPGKATIELTEKCSQCGGEVNIEIGRTLSGFGLMGGVLLKKGRSGYVTKCLDCYKLNSN